jgi:hypothetical protein
MLARVQSIRHRDKRAVMLNPACVLRMSGAVLASSACTRTCMPVTRRSVAIACERVGPQRITRMCRLRLNTPLPAEFRRFIVEHGRPAGVSGLSRVSEFFAVTAREIGIVVGFKLRAACERAMGPVWEIAPRLADPLSRIGL